MVVMVRLVRVGLSVVLACSCIFIIAFLITIDDSNAIKADPQKEICDNVYGP